MSSNQSSGVSVYSVEYDISEPLYQVVTTVLVLINVFGLVVHTAVFLAFFSQSKMKTVPNILLLNISIADGIFLIFGLPYLISQYSKGEWIYKDEWCNVVRPMDTLRQYVVVYTLAALAIDKYLMIVHPHKIILRRTVNRAKYLDAALFGFSFLLTLPNWVLASVVNKDPYTNGICSHAHQNWLALFSFICGYVFPLATVATSLLLVLKNLRVWNPSNNGVEQRSKPSRKFTLLVITLAVVFAVCYLPYFIVTLSSELQGTQEWESEDHLKAYLGTISFAYMNIALNPLLCIIINNSYRQGFVSLIPNKRKKKNGRAITGEYRNWILKSWSMRRGSAYSNDSAKSLPYTSSSFHSYGALGLTSGQHKARRTRRKTI